VDSKPSLKAYYYLLSNVVSFIHEKFESVENDKFVDQVEQQLSQLTYLIHALKIK